jgi:hypothetical protein
MDDKRWRDAAWLAGVHDTTAGWLLMADAGESLRTVARREQSLDRWYEILPFYAGIQLDLADDVGTLLGRRRAVP